VELGLTSPVRVTFVKYGPMSDQGGRYVRLGETGHRLSVCGHATPREASSILWHELAHAVQVERLGGHRLFEQLWARELREAGISWRQLRESAYSVRAYRSMPLEREADRVAAACGRVRLVGRLGD